MSLDNRNRQEPITYFDFVKRVSDNETVLPERPTGPLPEYRKKGKGGVILGGTNYIMDGYGNYSREPPLARSPTERTNWAGRDDGFRSVKIERDDGFRGARPDRDRESFHRGRSPGMSLLFLILMISPLNASLQGCMISPELTSFFYLLSCLHSCSFSRW